MQQTSIQYGKLFPFIMPDMFCEGKSVIVFITQAPSDVRIPRDVRKNMKGLCLETVFTWEQVIKSHPQIGKVLPEGTRLAYTDTVIRALREMGRPNASAKLAKNMMGNLDMVQIDPECCVAFDPWNN